MSSDPRSLGGAAGRTGASVLTSLVGAPTKYPISEFDDKGPGWAWYWYELGEHAGTHFDAPSHWITGRELPSLDRLDAGATHLILNLRPPYPAGIVRRLADEVVPAVRA